MFVSKSREKERYYLFAGMGGPSVRRKLRLLSLGTGLAAGAFVALVLFALNRHY